MMRKMIRWIVGVGRKQKQEAEKREAAEDESDEEAHGRQPVGWEGNHQPRRHDEECHQRDGDDDAAVNRVSETLRNGLTVDHYLPVFLVPEARKRRSS